MSASEVLLEKIAARSARVGVIGLGYVGLPLAVEFARNGFTAIGFEVDKPKVARINSGESYIPDVPTSDLAAVVNADKLQATTDFEMLGTVDVIIICVPTPLRKTKEPDVSFILDAAGRIQDTLRSGQLIILESTTYPGTTDEVLLPMLEETGMKIDEDYFLAFSPERIDPGNANFHTRNIPKVVGGVSEKSTAVAAAIYGAIVENVHTVSSARVAETCKLLENTFRAVNIGLVNELSQLCHTLEIDTWEVIQAAATKPFGFMAFFPGPGIGGHCLVGDETVIVRSAVDKIEKVDNIKAVFEAEATRKGAGMHKTDSMDIVTRPALEALSLNTVSQTTEWKPVSHIFRRRFDGPLTTIRTTDNRCITVTDQHPMLVANEDGTTRQVPARSVSIGDRLPIHCWEAPLLVD